MDGAGSEADFNNIAIAVTQLEEGKAEFLRLHRLIQEETDPALVLTRIHEAAFAYNCWRRVAFELRDLRR